MSDIKQRASFDIYNTYCGHFQHSVGCQCHIGKPVGIAAMQASIDDLRAEVERYREMAQVAESQLTAAQGEVERLKQDNWYHCTRLFTTQMWMDMEEENQELKSQLSRYSGAVEVEGMVTSAGSIYLRTSAKEALENAGLHIGQRVKVLVMKGEE